MPLHEPLPVQTVEPVLGIGAPTDKVFMLSEVQKPGEYMSAFEDEHGTYIMNSKDLRAIQHVARLAQLGVHSLKIEGRTKSFYYCALTAKVCRRAIDDAKLDKPFDPTLLITLEGLVHRGYTEGFLRRHVHEAQQNYDYGSSLSKRQQFVGEFTGLRRDGWAEVEVKNKFMLGDNVEIMTPSDNVLFTLECIQNKKCEPITVVPGNDHIVYLPIHQGYRSQLRLVNS